MPKVSAKTKKALLSLRPDTLVDTAKIKIMAQQTVLLDQIATSLRRIEKKLRRRT